MGHACQILKFDTDDKARIQMECDEWGDYNCDPYERGGIGGGLESPIHFTSLIFKNEEEADEYLEKTFGRYDQTAVRYYKYPKREQTKEEKKLSERLGKAWTVYQELECKAHYKGVKSQYIACPNCGSRLATKFCGVTWNNVCPVCKKDVRPGTVLEKRDSLKKSIGELDKKLKMVRHQNDEKNSKKAKLCWAVACEVHC